MTAWEHSDGTPGQPGGDGARDLRLVREKLAGNPLAVQAFELRMLCICRIVAGRNARLGYGLDRAELEDVVQDVAVSVLEHLGEYSGMAPLEAWIYSFCDHELRNAVRRKRRRSARQAPLEHEPAAAVVGDHAYSDELLDCMHRLMSEEREMIWARHYGELSLQELARRIACKLNTLKSRLYRTYGQLRECLQTKRGLR